MSTQPLDDIEAWSKTLSPWKQDCLRRLAISNELTQTDFDELLALIKHKAGFPLTTQPPNPVPFAKAHFGGGNQQPVILRGIANIQNVNRLIPNAGLTFGPSNLTIVYGRNGSGKSGFVRILRTACRTRVENPAKLQVLSDVYANASGPQSANIIIDAGAGDVPIAWHPGMTADPLLLQVGVFDTASAELYVNNGNQIRFLPFGLALPHRLNAVCLSLKTRIENERTVAVGDKVALTAVTFDVVRSTAAQTFEKSLSKITTDPEIDAAAAFAKSDQQRLDDVTALLTAGSTAAADVAALATWVGLISAECEKAFLLLNDDGLNKLGALKQKADSARAAAQQSADAMFASEPLPGVGSETWRAMWEAARDYSVSDAYVGRDYPVTVLEGGVANCVLCQQPLLPDGAERMVKFEKFVSDALDTAASAFEDAVNKERDGLIQFEHLDAQDFKDRIEQVRNRDTALAAALSEFQTAAIERRDEAISRLEGNAAKPTTGFTSPVSLLASFADKLKKEADELVKAKEIDERAKLTSEKAELEDRKILASNRAKLLTRRDLLVADAAYATALSEVATTGITKRANELIDTHLTKPVVDSFDAERKKFDILHLNVSLERKSGQTKAEFEIDTQTELTKLTSEILSEGEQRALALAGFLTEVALTDGSGPIVVDDPVSSLDRDRCVKVAERLAEEISKRQVVVFTHDIIFFNELHRAADEVGISPSTIAMFSDNSASGKVDPAGIVWKGKKVDQRLGQLKSDAAPLQKLSSTSPADYEYQIKNLYGRLRDTYERVVEEIIFQNVVQRGSDVIQTLLLRYVRLSDPLAIRFHEGMTKANTHSHDNPAADTVAVPTPTDFQNDIAALETLIADLKAESKAAEKARPQMMPKK